MKNVLPILTIAFLAACGNINTPITGPTNEPFVEIPINDNPPVENLGGGVSTETPTAYCKRNARGDFDTNLKIDGGGDGKTFYWAQGGSCLLLPLADAWKLFQNQKKLAWDGTSNNLYLKHTVGEDGSHYFLDRYSATKLIFTVSWDMEWYHSINSGTVENPLSVLINYKKVSGTSHIRYWEGSIVLERVTDNVTSFTMRNQIHADQTKLQETKETISDLLNRVMR